MTRPTLVAFACLLLTALAWGTYGHVQLNRARTAAQKLEAELNLAHAQIEAQNAGIAALKAAATAQEKQAAEATAKVAEVQRTAEARIASIRAKQRPQTCEQAIQFLIDDARGSE